MIETLKREASRLLQEGYDGVVGLRKRWGHIGPYLFTHADELQDLVVEPRYPIARFICQMQKIWPDRRLGAVVRGCDERALKELEKRGAFKKDGFAFIGIVCSSEQAEACNCEKPAYTTFQCTGCWKCVESCEKEAIRRINVCPIIRPNKFDMGLSKRKAIYLAFPQAVPKKATRDADHCLKITEKLDCKGCENVCEAKAISHDMTDEILELDVGAILVSTGLDFYDVSKLGEYGYGKIPNVITAMEFERLTSASGPTGGELKRPSDKRIPSNIAFIQCVGSRDFKNKPYCSSVCCMHATKEAILAYEHHRGTKSTIFYMDLRAVGKRFQEYVTRAKEEYNTTYIRGRPGKIEVNDHNGNPIIWYEDTTTGETKTFETDLVILCQALVPSEGIEELAKILDISLDAYNFVETPDKLFHPLDTTSPGIIACGYVHSPKDIPDSVVQASGAAARAAEIIANKASKLVAGGVKDA